MTDPATRQVRRRLWVALGLGLAVSVFLAWQLLRRIDLGRVLPLAAEARLGPLAAMMASKLVGFLALAWRVRALLRPYRELTMGVALRGQLLGFAANNLVPFRLGELAKVDYLARRGGGSRSAVLAVAATERILDVFCLLGLFMLVSPLVLPRVSHPGAIAASAATVAAAATCGWLIAARASTWIRGFRTLETWLGLPGGGRLSVAADSFARGLAAFRSPAVLASGLAGTIAYWACGFASIQLCLDAFGIVTPWYAPAVVLAFLAFGTALPASPGFVGTYDYFFVAALLAVGLDANRAASVALVAHTLSIVPLTIVGLLVVPGSLGWLSERVRGLARVPHASLAAGPDAGGSS